jgi:hypothetical protein
LCIEAPARLLLSLLLLHALLIGTPILSAAQAERSSPSSFAWGHVWWSDGRCDGVSNTFLVKRARFGMKGYASDNWFYCFMIEGMSSPKLLDAWVEFKCATEFRVRVGQFKHGFGREAYASARTWRFITPSRAVDELGKNHVDGGSSFRDQGIMIHGMLRAAELPIDYSLFVMNGNGINAADTNTSKDVVARIAARLPSGLLGGGTFYSGENGDARLSRSGFGFDVGLVSGRVWITCEYLAGTVEQGRGVDDLRKAGYYLGATYQAADAVEVAWRYDTWDPDTDQAGDGESRITVGASYWFAEGNRITLNVEMPSVEDDGAGLDSSMVVQFQGSLG